MTLQEEQLRETFDKVLEAYHNGQLPLEQIESQLNNLLDGE